MIYVLKDGDVLPDVYVVSKNSKHLHRKKTDSMLVQIMMASSPK